MAMKPSGWKSVAHIERDATGLPFPSKWYKGEYSNGEDHDGNFIATQLARMSLMQRSKAVEGYNAAYAGVDSRGNCNGRLEAYADRCVRSNSGRTKSPGRMKQ